MAIQLSDWYDELAVNVPGATVAGMEQALQKTLADFLRRSGAFSKDIPSIALRAARSTYTISKQPEGPIILVHDFFFRGRPLAFIDQVQWMSLDLDRTAEAPWGVRRYIDEPLRFTVYPTPEADLTDRVTPYVSFGYSSTCQDYLPDFFATQWYEVILSGAIFRLCSQQGKPYTDATIAGLHGRKFTAGIATARDQASKQFTKAETPFRFPTWA